MIDYCIEVVGGPFDGAPGMRWADDGNHPPPEMILVGICPGSRECGLSRCNGRRHTYYWLPEEAGTPTRTQSYELQDSYIEPEGRRREPDVAGRAIYVIGALLLPRGDDARELVPVGADGGELEPATGVYADGHRRAGLAAWIVPQLEWARTHGWRHVPVTSGYRDALTSTEEGQ